MKFFAAGLGLFVMISVLVLFTAGINATIVWWLWPTAIPAVLPSLVQSGVVAAKLTWAQSFALCWLSHILFAKFVYSSNTDKK